MSCGLSPAGPPTRWDVSCGAASFLCQAGVSQSLISLSRSRHFWGWKPEGTTSIHKKDDKTRLGDNKEAALRVIDTYVCMVRTSFSLWLPRIHLIIEGNVLNLNQEADEKAM